MWEEITKPFQKLQQLHMLFLPTRCKGLYYFSLLAFKLIHVIQTDSVNPLLIPLSNGKTKQNYDGLHRENLYKIIAWISAEFLHKTSTVQLLYVSSYQGGWFNFWWNDFIVSNYWTIIKVCRRSPLKRALEGLFVNRI